MNKTVLIILIIAVVVILLIVIGRVAINYYTGKVLLEKYMADKKMRSGNRPAKLSPAERKIPVVEAFLMKYGASPIHTKNQAKLKHRSTFKLGDAYYRAAIEPIEGRDFIILYAVENPKYADVGVMDSVAVFDVDTPDADIEKEITKIIM